MLLVELSSFLLTFLSKLFITGLALEGARYGGGAISSRTNVQTQR